MPKPQPILRVVTVVLLTACGPEDRQAPTTADLTIEKAPGESGDAQVGVAGEPLPRDLRARITRDGKPVEGVMVYWTTFQGELNPPSDLTGADGISASRWTTQYAYLEEEAFASLDPVTGPRPPGSVLPGMIMYTALAYPDPDAPNTVLVLNEGGNRFEPASIAIGVGDTINWFWTVGSGGHNVVPDDANAPATSGAPAGYPKYLSFTFAIPWRVPIPLRGARRAGRCRDVRRGDGAPAAAGYGAVTASTPRTTSAKSGSPGPPALSPSSKLIVQLGKLPVTCAAGGAGAGSPARAVPWLNRSTA